MSIADILSRVLLVGVGLWMLYLFWLLSKQIDKDRLQRQYPPESIEFLETLWANHDSLTISKHTIPDKYIMRYDVPAGIFGDDELLLVVEQNNWALFQTVTRETGVKELKLVSIFSYDETKGQPDVFKSLSYWNSLNFLQYKPE